jgi:hypothetical protein
LNQSELRQMVQERVIDAKTLLDGGRWEFAYYTIGYSVECALKSCVLAQIVHSGWLFEVDAKKILEDCRTHDFTRLIQIAGMSSILGQQLAVSAKANDGFLQNWETTKVWVVDSRYAAKTELEAKKLYAAITDEPNGILKWIKNHW